MAPSRSCWALMALSCGGAAALLEEVLPSLSHEPQRYRRQLAQVVESVRRPTWWGHAAFAQCRAMPPKLCFLRRESFSRPVFGSGAPAPPLCPPSSSPGAVSLPLLPSVG